MASAYEPISITSAETAGQGIIIHFSDGMVILFHTHFLYEMRGAHGNVLLTGMSDEDLMKGFDDPEHG